ncbi:hypothetical protein TNCV_3682861 [Trichonephila clavipes]|uniref:Uncharacterized protein n=1 Tax=Trichonephila clavipes TaxID=2585209 RepID=A0A8X6RBP3_TRICX|nr:hypothetical protein TNCV_3682861 [Trichonephila clavipes]
MEQYFLTHHPDMSEEIITSQCSATGGLLATDHVILNHSQVTWTTPELTSPSSNYHPNGMTFQLSTDLACIAALHGLEKPRERRTEEKRSKKTRAGRFRKVEKEESRSFEPGC